MIDRAAASLHMMITKRISAAECTVMDSAAMTEKTIILLDDNNFTRTLLSRLRELPASCLCRVESVAGFEGKLLVLASESGETVGNSSVYTAHAACCAALVLKDCGAVHNALLPSVRRCGELLRVFGFDSVVPYTPDGEAAELRAIEEASGFSGDSLESLREQLAVHIGRWDVVHRRAKEAERVRETLMANPSFREEWSGLEYINAGAYGFIYRALSSVDGKEYALKVMCVGNDAEKMWKAKRESTNASQFWMNNYIVRTYDDGKILAGQDRYIWISMELLEPIPAEISDEKTVALIARDVCRALDEIHKNGGMAHRDVKPGNILRGSTGWKLCDFGITKEVQGRDMATVIGTSEYMAPELLRALAANSTKASYDNTVDIYALGITMYTLLNRGTAPFLSVPPCLPTAAEKKNASIARIKGEPLPPAVNCSPRLMKIIARACSHSPSDRYASVSRMHDALEDFLEDFS